MVNPVGIAEIPTVDNDTTMLHTIHTDIFVADDRRALPVGICGDMPIVTGNVTIQFYSIRAVAVVAVSGRRAKVEIFPGVKFIPQESQFTPLP